MTPERFEEIKKKYEQAKAKASKAEGAKEQLLQSLKDEWDLTSLEEIDAKLEELEKAITTGEKEISSLGDELEKVTDWGAI
jgi:septal ring factor EnvC (AmiA/AmiB activator)